jgi:hypothetical protein
MKRLLLLAALYLPLFVLPAGLAHAYTYIQEEGEYSVDLPEAPTGISIWADTGETVPYLDNPPKYGWLGETCKIRRADVDSGDTFSVDITFLKADHDFLQGLTKDKMMAALRDLYKDTPLDNHEEHYSAGTDTLKWATLTGFNVDKMNSLHYNAAHFLSGLETIMVIKVDYNVENKVFQRWYDTLAKSIKFVGK